MRFVLASYLQRALHDVRDVQRIAHTWLLWAVLQWDAGDEVQGLKQRLDCNYRLPLWCFLFPVFVGLTVLPGTAESISDRSRGENPAHSAPAWRLTPRLGAAGPGDAPPRASASCARLRCVVPGLAEMFWLPGANFSGHIWGAPQPPNPPPPPPSPW